MRVTISKSEWDALPNDDRAAYVAIENGAKYRVIEAQSLVDALTGRVDEFRENNRGLNTQLRSLTERLDAVGPLVAAIGDRKPEDISAAFARLTALEAGGVSKPDDVADKINASMAPLRSELGNLRGMITEKETQLQHQQLQSALASAAIQGGVSDDMLDEFVQAARRDGATYKNGAVEFLDANGAKRYSTDGGLMTIASFIDDLRVRKPPYFRATAGLGLDGRPTAAGQRNSVRVIKRSEAHRHMADIATGKVVVED